MATYVMIAAAVVGAIQGQQQAASAERQQQANAQAQSYNAAVGRQNAEAARAAGSVQEDMQRRQARLFSGKQRAAVAEAGLGLNGSNADVERQSEVSLELDALGIRYNSELKAHGMLSGAALSDYGAANSTANASAISSSGTLGLAGGLLSAGGSYIKSKNSTYNFGGSSGGASFTAPPSIG